MVSIESYLRGHKEQASS